MASRHATRIEVLALAPELTDSPVLDIVLDIAASMATTAAWADKTSSAHALLTAHFMTSMGGDSSGQTVVSKSIEGASITYLTSQLSDAELGSTKYGRLYTMLRASLVQSKSFSEPGAGWYPDNDSTRIL
jgi:hypothetical protein